MYYNNAMTVHLNLISSYTLMKSTIRIPALVQDLKNKGYDCCALTDHNVLYGTASFLHECQKAGIKAIIGMETDVIYHEETVPFLLLSMDTRGYRNLIKLSSVINTRRERACTIEEFTAYSEGCTIIAYGEGGWMDSELVHEQYERVMEKLQIMKRELPEFDMALSYMEASLWKNRNTRLKRLCQNLRIHTVALNRICYLNRNDAAVLRVLTAIDRNITLNDASLPNIQGRYVLTRQEMERLYDEDDLSRTDEIAARCTCAYTLPSAGLPVFENGNGVSSEEYLRSLCYAGLKKRLNGNLKSEYVNRLKYELDVITKMGFSDYFLIVYDFIRYGRTHDILIGPGRGSAAGSLAAYCLGITMVDPIQYGLLFERFLNPDRVSLPDIDTDIPDNRRDEIIRYVTQRYGMDHVCNIITFGTFGARQAIRDVGKVMALPQREVDTISKRIPNKAKMTLELAMKTEPRFSSIIHSRKTYETLYETARMIEGLPRHESIHAAGIIMSGKPLSQVLPTVRFSDEILTSQFTMEYLEERGLIKMDFLGLRNLSIIDEIVQEIRIRRPDFSIMHIPVQDPKTMQVFSSGDTTGIFQFESEGMKNLLRRMKPKDINDIACAMALYRPSASMHINEYLNRRLHPETITYPCRELVPVLRETCGIMIYQEQVMQCATTVAGFTLAKADILRRAISKKNMEVMASMKQEFITGCVKNGHSEQLGDQLFALIEQFAGYGFNKSHAVAYSFIALQLAWLKAHVPLIFYTALLNSCIGDQKKTGQYIDECRKRKITICYPDVNVSTLSYIHDAAGITLPFTAISSIGSSTASLLVSEREEHGPYRDYIDFVARVSMHRVTKANIEALIDAGALDRFDYNRQTMKDGLDDVLRYSELVRIEEGGQMRIDLSLISAPAIILRAQSQDEKNENERKVLGFTLGPSLTAQIRQENSINVPVLAVIETMKGEVDGFAQIRDVHEHRTKKGSLMAFLTIADETAKMEMRVMPMQYTKYNSLLIRGRYILFHAKMTEEGYLIGENIRGIGRGKQI